MFRGGYPLGANRSHAALTIRGALYQVYLPHATR